MKHEVTVFKKPTPDTVRIGCPVKKGCVFIEGQFADAITHCPMCGGELPEKEFRD